MKERERQTDRQTDRGGQRAIEREEGRGKIYKRHFLSLPVVG